MTLVIVILMIFLDTLVKIKKLKNFNLYMKKIVEFGGRFFFCSVYKLNTITGSSMIGNRYNRLSVTNP